MSHFTLQIDPQGGPLLKLAIGVSEARSAALTAAAQQIPPAETIVALVDTGASLTCIDPEILVGKLGLSPTGQVDCLTPSTGATPHKGDLYDVSLRMIAALHEPHLYLASTPVMSSNLLVGQGIHALLGRDVLDDCVLIYNGETKLFTLAF